MTRHSIHDVQHPTAENPDDGIVASAIDLTKVYGSKDNEVMALDHVNVEFKRGEMTAIMGPSGSGKSTLLRSLNMLEEPTSGAIFFDGVDLASKSVNIDLHRQKMGMVFQHFNLFPHKTVLQNITLALGVKALFFALTFTGHATMWMAVFADVGTALLVVANGLRAMRQ